LASQRVDDCIFIHKILFCQQNNSLTTLHGEPRVVAPLAAREPLDSSESADDGSAHGPGIDARGVAARDEYRDFTHIPLRCQSNTDTIAVFRIQPSNGKLKFSTLLNAPTPVDVEFGAQA
jgi:hypothetical protein